MADRHARDLRRPPSSARREGGLDSLKIGSMVAYIHRHKYRLPRLEPRSDLGFAADFLYMVTGEEPSEASEKLMNVLFVLHADHELNVSTFTARVGRVHPLGRLLEHHSGGGGAEGTPPRRSQREGRRDGRGDRLAGPRRGVHPPAAGAQGEDNGFRPSHLQDERPPGDDPEEVCGRVVSTDEERTTWPSSTACLS